MSVLVAVEQLQKMYLVGLLRKKVEAVKNISFEVKKGEIVGLVGPNGSGKTTTIKVMMGLCQPTRGQIRLFGLPAHEAKAREKLGFLPENPYVYPHLTPREFVDLCARLSGVKRKVRSDRVTEVLRRTGVLYAADRPVRSMSKGMLQRSGLAAALVADPELLVLDEPMSGLDPLGRREVRDLIAEERRLGRTVLFSSHVLSDVEALCDRVVILHKGEVVVTGAVRDLVEHEARYTELSLRHVDDALAASLLSTFHDAVSVLRTVGDERVYEVKGEESLHQVVEHAIRHGARMVSAVPRKDSLEDLFVRKAVQANSNVQR